MAPFWPKQAWFTDLQKLTGGKTHSSSPVGENTHAAKIQRISPQSTHVKPTCVDIVQTSIEEKGFSSESSRRVMVPQALSTLKVHASKWKVFETWCLSKDIDPFKATIPQIANFLLYLSHKKKLAFKSVEGYRMAISRPIKLATGLYVGQDTLWLNLIKSFLRERPGALQPFPAWEFSFVLFSLIKQPFKPISGIPPWETPDSENGLSHSPIIWC